MSMTIERLKNNFNKTPKLNAYAMEFIISLFFEEVSKNNERLQLSEEEYDMLGQILDQIETNKLVRKKLVSKEEKPEEWEILEIRDLPEKQKILISKVEKHFKEKDLESANESFSKVYEFYFEKKKRKPKELCNLNAKITIEEVKIEYKKGVPVLAVKDFPPEIKEVYEAFIRDIDNNDTVDARNKVSEIFEFLEDINKEVCPTLSQHYWRLVLKEEGKEFSENPIKYIGSWMKGRL